MLATMDSPETSPPADMDGANPIQPESYYSPKRVDRWLRDWPLLESLSETPRSSRHYLTWEHRNRLGPCLDDPRVEQRGHARLGNELSFSDIKADIERAWCKLRPVPTQKGTEGLDAKITVGSSGRWGIHFLVIEWRMKFSPVMVVGRDGVERLEWHPTAFDKIDKALRVRHGTASSAYKEAIEAMAWRLGWTGQREEEEE